MKRLSLILIALALLCVACGGQASTTVPAASAATESGASTQTAQATASPTIAPDVSALDDPTDAAKETTDDFSVTFDGGTIEPSGSVYTITAAGEYTVTGALSDGQLIIDAGDDGLNACKGTETPAIVIRGGYAEIRTPSGDTDGIDSNGTITMTGGTVLVMSGAQMGGMAGSVDADGTVTVTGGTIVALGGICQLPSGNSVNTYVSSGTSFSAGSYQLTDASGNTIFSFTLSGSYAGCWIASDAFALNGSYSVEKDGETVISWTQSSQTEGSYQSGFGGFGRR